MTVFFELALKRTLRQKTLVIAMMVFPVILATAPHPAREAPPIGFTLYGLIILFSGFLLTKQIIDDRSYGTITRIAAAPIRHFEYLLGHMGAYLLILLIQNLVFTVIAHASFESLDISLGMLFVTYAVFSILSITFSLFWHMLFRTYATSIAIYSVIVNMVAMLGGLIVPIPFLPERIITIGRILPTYWFANAVQHVYEGSNLTALLSLFIVISFAIMFLVMGSKRRLT